MTPWFWTHPAEQARDFLEEQRRLAALEMDGAFGGMTRAFGRGSDDHAQEERLQANHKIRRAA